MDIRGSLLENLNPNPNPNPLPFAFGENPSSTFQYIVQDAHMHTFALRDTKTGKKHLPH